MPMALAPHPTLALATPRPLARHAQPNVSHGLGHASVHRRDCRIARGLMDLPEELLEIIFSYLEAAHDAGNVALTCRACYRITVPQRWHLVTLCPGTCTALFSDLQAPHVLYPDMTTGALVLPHIKHLCFLEDDDSDDEMTMDGSAQTTDPYANHLATTRKKSSNAHINMFDQVPEEAWSLLTSLSSLTLYQMSLDLDSLRRLCCLFSDSPERRRVPLRHLHVTFDPTRWFPLGGQSWFDVLLYGLIGPNLPHLHTLHLDVQQGCGTLYRHMRKAARALPLYKPTRSMHEDGDPHEGSSNISGQNQYMSIGHSSTEESDMTIGRLSSKEPTMTIGRSLSEETSMTMERSSLLTEENVETLGRSSMALHNMTFGRLSTMENGMTLGRLSTEEHDITMGRPEYDITMPSSPMSDHAFGRFETSSRRSSVVSQLMEDPYLSPRRHRLPLLGRDLAFCDGMNRQLSAFFRNEGGDLGAASMLGDDHLALQILLGTSTSAAMHPASCPNLSRLTIHMSLDLDDMVHILSSDNAALSMPCLDALHISGDTVALSLTQPPLYTTMPDRGKTTVVCVDALRLQEEDVAPVRLTEDVPSSDAAVPRNPIDAQEDPAQPTARRLTVDDIDDTKLDDMLRPHGIHLSTDIGPPSFQVPLTILYDHLDILRAENDVEEDGRAIRA